MDRKAIDVVLLPDEPMTDKAVDTNKELVKKGSRKIILNKQTCLPHISLAMGCIDERALPEIEKILKEIARQTALTGLRVVGIQTSTNSVGEKVSVFEVEKVKELQLLHEEVMERLTGFLSPDVSKETLYDPAEVGQSTLLWIKKYREKSSFENFFPHITIGYGEIENGPFPIRFGASKLAMCHLGSHCTCREILASIKLGAEL